MANTIAVIFDFDETLAPDSTTLFLKQMGVDPTDFWGTETRELVTRGFDPTLAFLELFLDKVGQDLPLGLLTNNDLAQFGASINNMFYPGVPDLFRDLHDLLKPFDFLDISIEFYIISGGLQAMILGIPLVTKHFKHVYACELAETGNPPRLARIKRAVTFTEKTRYLFEINKGMIPSMTQGNPYLVNEFIDPSRRRIPFRNMIYLGDGLTDIPCFSLLDQYGGISFGVFDPTDQNKAKRGLTALLRTNRVVSLHSPQYGKDHDLGALIRAAVSTICSRIMVEQETADSHQASSRFGR